MYQIKKIGPKQPFACKLSFMTGDRCRNSTPLPEDGSCTYSGDSGEMNASWNKSTEYLLVCHDQIGIHQY